MANILSASMLGHLHPHAVTPHVEDPLLYDGSRHPLQQTNKENRHHLRRHPMHLSPTTLHRQHQTRRLSRRNTLTAHPMVVLDQQLRQDPQLRSNRLREAQ